MLFRVILFTLILGGTVVVNLAWGTPEDLGGPYVTFLFVFIAVIYVMNILYAVLLRWVTNLEGFAIVQLCIDLLISAILVHFTGGAESGFVLFFLLTPIAAAVTLTRRAAMFIAIAGTIVFTVVAFLGYYRWLPILPGQVQIPWAASPGSLGRSLLVNGIAMISLAILSGYLAAQLRSASAKVEVQQAFIDDLAALNADIIRCLTSGLITVDDRGTILTMNMAAGEILGVQYEEAGGKLLNAFIPELARTVAHAREVRQAELIINRDGQSKLLALSISPLTDHLNQIQGRIINFQDLTAIRQMEQRVKRSEHLASLGRMAAGIAHEIRNPLASISGSLELLRSDEKLNPEKEKLMGIALREIERLDNLITNVLNYARPQPPDMVAMDLGKVIHGLVESIANLMTENNSPALHVSQTSESLWVRTDRDQFLGILWNLVRNSWEAGETQRVDIRIGPHRSDFVMLQVIDHASGIERDIQDKIFEPFFTTKETGTGLGLATVHRIVQDHGGSIEVQSTRDQGTTVTILLPRVEPDHAPDISG